MQTIKNNLLELSFSDFCQKSGLFEYGPTKGTIFLTPRGYHLWSRVQHYLDQRFANLGVDNVYFPSLIPLSLLKKEQQHVQGFAPELFIVNKVGGKTLKEPLALRPTSEVLFCNYFQKVVKSYRHLPLLLNQWVNVWRWEQNANPFLRNTEFLWQEGHTLHHDQKTAVAFCQQIRTVYKNFLEQHLSLPVFAGQKSELEKFAGAQTTWTFETLLPDGQFLQLATVHYLEKNFTKPFQIKFLDQSNKWNYAHQTSWGLSTRIIAAIVQVHRDQHGLVLPLALAKEQLAILPIYRKNDEKTNDEIDQYCQKIVNSLQKFHLKIVRPDFKEKNFSLHCKEMELKGVPIRLEIGYREASKNQVTYVLRSNLEKTTVDLNSFLESFSEIIASMNKDLFNKAQQKLVNRKKIVANFQDYLPLKKDQAFQVFFCNRVECEKTIKELTQTVSRFIWKDNDHSKQHNCFKCHQKTSWIAIFGRSY